MELITTINSFQLKNGQDILLEAGPEKPMLYVGYGRESVNMYRGNFEIVDYVSERIPLYPVEIRELKDTLSINFSNKVQGFITIWEDACEVQFQSLDEKINRFWLRIHADSEEHVYGCGEQMSYFDLRGRHFPLWTGEPGVGRDKNTYITWKSDVENKAGGDYYNTNYPEPTFVSSKCYYLHVDSTAYADFDFRNMNFHELQIWEVPAKVRLECADSFSELLKKETAFFGRQPELPDWIYNGLIFGVQGGNDRSFGLAEKVQQGGVKLAGIWCQDWCGKRVTSFGKRLQWDWHFQENMYPGLPDKIQELHKSGVRFLGYVNPYLVNDGMLFREGEEKGYFVKRHDGKTYLVDFGEFYCGAVDLTNPAAFQWFKNIIKKYSIDIGIDGWMADFGEYLPTDDVVLHSGISAMKEHNHWPVLWARCNYEALEENGKLGKIFYFMRAGGAGTQKYCTLLWAGDQSVDFSRHDGLCTVISAALSSGMIGMGLSHSDIGGYTSLFGNVRSKEVFFRWAEMAAFTPVMRTHEGNRPDECYQFYNDEDGISRMARLVNLYRELSPYIKQLVKENHEEGTPVQRPLFFHYTGDERYYTEQFEYLLGRDMLVAPVWQEAQKEREVYLPEDTWVHLWTGGIYGFGSNIVATPLGYPAVFYRKDSSFKELFATIGKKYGRNMHDLY